jgi:ABC-type glycerol-3-phosphate transport system substrate-binding protein
LSVKQGAPLGVVKMRAEQESWGGEQLLGVSRNAPHPSAARLFAEFILSKEGNAIVNADADNWGVVASGGLPIGHEHYIPMKAASSSKERVNRIIALLGL